MHLFYMFPIDLQSTHQVVFAIAEKRILNRVGIFNHKYNGN